MKLKITQRFPCTSCTTKSVGGIAPYLILPKSIHGATPFDMCFARTNFPIDELDAKVTLKISGESPSCKRIHGRSEIQDRLLTPTVCNQVSNGNSY